MSLSATKATSKSASSANSLLRPVFDALRFEIEALPRLCGAAVAGYNDVFERFQPFAKKRRKEANIFAATIDLERCFDLVHPKRAYAIAQKILRSK